MDSNQFLSALDEHVEGIGTVDGCKHLFQTLARVGPLVIQQQNQIIGLHTRPVCDRSLANLVNKGWRFC